MADAIPPTLAGTAVTASGGTAPVAVAASSVSGAALKLSEGALMEAVANARASKGVVEVTTSEGTFQLKALPGQSLPAFAPGSKLTLQSGTGGQLYLVAVNGRPLVGLTMATMGQPLPGLMTILPQAGGQQPQAHGAAVLAGGSPATAGHTLSGQPGVTPNASPLTAGASGATSAGTPASPPGLTATVIRPAQSPLPPGTMPATISGAVGAGTVSLPPDLPAGTRLTVRIAGVGISPQQQGGTPTPGAGPAIPSPRTNAAVQMPLSQGSPQTAQPQSSPQTVLLPAVVTAHPPGGQAVVQTAIGTLAVPTHADLASGTRLTLEVIGKPVPPPPAATTAPVPSSPALGAQGWPVLSQALDVLAQSNQPQALEQLLRALPQADTRLAASMAAFASGLRGGPDGRSPLPDSAVRGLDKAGRKDLAARLLGDLEDLRQETGRPLAGGEWRVHTMPFLNGGAIEPVRLFVRRTPDDEAATGSGGRGDRNNDHRFVLDLNLSRLGRVQLDGLVRREEKLFDLIIRTGEPLDTETRRDILGIFTNASELVGTKGTVSFQSGGRWLDFPPAPPAPTRLEV